MTTTVTGGQVLLNGQAQKYAVAVEKIVFDLNRVHGQVPVGATGPMTLTSVPSPNRYQVGDQLNYSDGNNNNNATLDVTATIGPSKYTVRRSA